MARLAGALGKLIEDPATKTCRDARAFVFYPAVQEGIFTTKANKNGRVRTRVLRGVLDQIEEYAFQAGRFAYHLPG